MVCKLCKFIYGLKQVSGSCNIGFDQMIKLFDFDQNHDESCVYEIFWDTAVSFFVLYIDDILLIENDLGVLSPIRTCL